MIQIVSIPHNGTNFLNDLLVSHGIQPDLVVHCTPGTMEDIKACKNIIIPIRPPDDVAKSWASRGETYSGWLWMWKTLKTIKGYRFFLEDKDLEGLSNHLGVELTSDWEPINHMEPKGEPNVSVADVKYARRIYSKMRKEG